MIRPPLCGLLTEAEEANTYLEDAYRYVHAAKHDMHRVMSDGSRFQQPLLRSAVESLDGRSGPCR